MFCPKCGGPTKVLSSIDGSLRERFRKCGCGYTFTTIEVVKTDPYLVEYIKEIIKDPTIKKLIGRGV